MNVLVIEPGHGSIWLTDAEYVDRFGKSNPKGRFVRGANWYHDGGPFLPDGGIDIPETMTYPRRLILKVEPSEKVPFHCANQCPMEDIPKDYDPTSNPDDLYPCGYRHWCPWCGDCEYCDGEGPHEWD